MPLTSLASGSKLGPIEIVFLAQAVWAKCTAREARGHD
jgi:hypothetical protein